MPNLCVNKVRIGADADHIQLLVDAEFSFERLYPCPLNKQEDWYEWQTEHWGTKWDRNHYSLKMKGDAGLQICFETAWGPPTKFFNYLVKKYHDMWIRCDWDEEGGYSGVYIVNWDEERNRIKKMDYSWPDWCLEEWAHRMANDDTKTFNSRPRTHCASEEEYNSKESDMAICLTRKQRRDLEELVKADYLQKKGCEATPEEVRKDAVRRKANELWPEYAGANQELS
jgi:hypothetical protein